MKKKLQPRPGTYVEYRRAWWPHGEWGTWCRVLDGQVPTEVLAETVKQFGNRESEFRLSAVKDKV